MKFPIFGHKDEHYVPAYQGMEENLSEIDVIAEQSRKAPTFSMQLKS